MRVTQEAVEALISRDDNDIKLTQECVEVIDNPSNQIRATQLCVEVILSVVPENYTDSAANCNFAY